MLCCGKDTASNLHSWIGWGQDYTKKERAALALRSRHERPQFGSTERQQLIDEMHQQALAAEAQEVSTHETCLN
jgi:hypothetical protein